MTARIEFFDTVALTADVPDLGLTAGAVGAVVEVFAGGAAFEVEFCDPSGATCGLHTPRAEQFISLHTRRLALWLRAMAA